MAIVVKRKTKLRRQAWLAGAGAFSVFVFALALPVAACWLTLQPLAAGSLLIKVLCLFLAIAGIFGLRFVAGPLLDKSLIPLRGYRGERIVCRELTHLPDEYRVLNDVQVNARGKTAQIDHVVVSPYGMWCIETKSHFGRIYGQRGDRTWTQVKKSERGRTHKKQVANWASDTEWRRSQLDQYLRERLDFWAPIKCLVVLVGGRMIKDVQNVVDWRDVRSEVQRSDTKVHLSEEQIRRIVDALLSDQP